MSLLRFWSRASETRRRSRARGTKGASSSSLAANVVSRRRCSTSFLLPFYTFGKEDRTPFLLEIHSREILNFSPTRASSSLDPPPFSSLQPSLVPPIPAHLSFPLSSQVLPRLGLLDPSPNRWINFRSSLAGQLYLSLPLSFRLRDASSSRSISSPLSPFSELKKSAPKGTSYKVFYIQRHGQGES